MSSAINGHKRLLASRGLLANGGIGSGVACVGNGPLLADVGILHEGFGYNKQMSDGVVVVDEISGTCADKNLKFHQ
jgi:hypothetical protein